MNTVNSYMSSIEELRTKRMSELSNGQDKSVALAMHSILTPEALQRLNNIKMVKPEIAAQFEMYLMQVYQSGQIKNPLSENQLVEILDKIMPKKDFSIRRI